MPAPIPLALALLVRDGAALLVHRSPSRQAHPDCWDLAGGHVEADEPPGDAVRRECFEELGIRIHEPLPMTLTVTDPSLDVHAFLVTRWDGEPLNAAPEEHDDLGWFRPDQLAGLTLAHPSSRQDIHLAIRSAQREDGSDA